MRLILKPVILIFFFLAAAAAMAQFNYFELPEGRKRVTANFENFDNLVVISMVINDTIPVRLLLDSGVEGVLITDMGIVSKLENSCVRTFKLNAPGTIDELDACITVPVKITFDKLNPLLTNLILLSEDYFSLDQYIGTQVHGLIGMEKFRRLAVTTDYDKNILQFIRPEDYKTPARSEVIPISLNRGKPYMTSRIELDNGRIMDLWLMIDSGANHPLLLEYDSLNGYKPDKSIDAVIGKGLAGNLHGNFARIGWMMLGNYRLDDVITSFTDNYLPGNVFHRLNRHGTLGAGALGRFKVTFDYTNNRMIISKGIKFRRPFEYNMSGLSFRAMGTGFNVFEVSEVIPRSPGSIAGIKAGDFLLSVDGKYTFNLSLGELNNMLSTKAGQLVNLTLSRNGETIFVKIRLKRLI